MAFNGNEHIEIGLLLTVIPKVPWTSLDIWSSKGRTFTGPNHFLLDQIKLTQFKCNILFSCIFIYLSPVFNFITPIFTKVIIIIMALNCWYSKVRTACEILVCICKITTGLARTMLSAYFACHEVIALIIIQSFAIGQPLQVKFMCLSNFLILLRFLPLVVTPWFSFSDSFQE